VVACLVLGWTSLAAAPGVVRVAVPEYSLQYLSFWIAQGAGFFEQEGLFVEVVVPPSPSGVVADLLEGSADVALLPPPLYLQLIAQQRQVVLFANLLRNDPISLVVSQQVAKARSLSPDAPLDDRLRGIRGLRVGVAPGPPTRLRALLASVGLDVDRDIDVVIVPGPEQTSALADGRVHALYAHTPYLETALDEQHAMLLVNQSSGDIPVVAACQVHALATTPTYVRDQPSVLVALTRAVYRAQLLAHADQMAAADALLHSAVPELDAQHLATLLGIYEPAVPESPMVSVDGVRQELSRFPATGAAPDLGGIDLSGYVARDIARAAIESVGDAPTVDCPA
jgi:ABC-type nitrate/sulfonate/bicarbonate transport system substrate-binding protein